MASPAPFEITVSQLGKRYNRDWIFRKLDGHWKAGEVIGVSGANGSGKSTLLRVLSGFLRPTKGKINWHINGESIEKSVVYKRVSLAAPYVSIVEELTLPEFLKFHFSFKDRLEGWSDEKIIDRLGFDRIGQRSIIDYSSGMKQRVKLATALFSATELVLLDEPTTNLDEEGKQWFHDLLQLVKRDRLVFVASNEESDFQQCNNRLNMLDFKH